MPSPLFDKRPPEANVTQKTARKFIDDQWRELLSSYGFGPRTQDGAEVWSSPHVNDQFVIGADEDGPYWGVTTGGTALEDIKVSGETDDLERTLEEMAEGPGHQREPEPEPFPEGYVPEMSDEDKEYMKEMKVVGRFRNADKKTAAHEPRFSFAVPMAAAGKVAFLVAKAGLRDFEVTNYEGDGESVFSFMTEPELHVAEDMVKAEYAAEIGAREGLWSEWAPKAQAAAKTAFGHPRTPEVAAGAVDAFYDDLAEEEEGGRGDDIYELLDYLKSNYRADTPEDLFDELVEEAVRLWRARKSGRRAGSKVAGQWGEKSYEGDTVHDILDGYRPKAGGGFDEPVPAEEVPRLLAELDVQGRTDPDDEEDYLGVVVFLVAHGSDVPRVYRQRALGVARALAGNEEYLATWTSPEARRAELEKEMDMLASKTAGFHPDDLKSLDIQYPERPGMTDAEVKKMDRYRRRKLVAWLGEMGLLDESGGGSDLLESYDAGDFWKRDEVYEEVRDMMKDHRRFETGYRRQMRGSAEGLGKYGLKLG